MVSERRRRSKLGPQVEISYCLGIPRLDRADARAVGLSVRAGLRAPAALRRRAQPRQVTGVRREFRGLQQGGVQRRCPPPQGHDEDPLFGPRVAVRHLRVHHRGLAPGQRHQLQLPAARQLGAGGRVPQRHAAAPRGGASWASARGGPGRRAGARCPVVPQRHRDVGRRIHYGQEVGRHALGDRRGLHGQRTGAATAERAGDSHGHAHGRGVVGRL
mmetsp:Transcript_65215/g.173321  ORF Transcript_65215/g.173321 Transcript_65215/m.173321 type:complete len:216 (-) Transcript_65215:88-735(-)